MLTPICVPCRLQMTCTKNHFLVRDPKAASGPSTYWLGDQWTCSSCGASVVAGFGKPFGEEYVTPEDGEALEFRYEMPREERS